MKIVKFLEILKLSTFTIIWICTIQIEWSWSFGLSSLREHGESCDSENKCNSRNLLVCPTAVGVCSCPEPDKIVYDPSAEKCVARVGRNCGPLSNGKSPDGNRNTLGCIEDAICDEGFCVCADGFFGTIHGNCQRKKAHGELCFQERECESSFNNPLVCVSGVCQCDARVQIFDNERKICVGIVGSECNHTSYTNECVEHGECKNGACVCQNGYTETSNSTCEKDYGQPCSIQHPCSDVYLACINGKCECQLPLHQVYDQRFCAFTILAKMEKRMGQCVSLVSGPCTRNFTRDDATQADRESKGVLRIEQKCTKNAECVDKGFYNECQCKEGFVQTKEGLCAPDYLESCENDECAAPLYCINGKCNCFDMFQVYDESSRKCVGLVGSRCTVKESRCVEYSSCVIYSHREIGKCLCDKYSVEISNRTCVYPI